MQERLDGSFGDIMDGESLLKKMFEDKLEMLTTKALHFGTKEELEDIKNQKDVYHRLEVLEEQVETLKPVKSSLLIPTEEQIEKYSKKYTKFKNK